MRRFSATDSPASKPAAACWTGGAIQPSTTARPAVGGLRPLRTRKSAAIPAGSASMSPKTLPRATASETSCSAQSSTGATPGAARRLRRLDKLSSASATVASGVIRGGAVAVSASARRARLRRARAARSAACSAVVSAYG